METKTAEKEIKKILQKFIDFKKFLKEIKQTAIVVLIFAAVFMVVLRQVQNKLWAVMPTSGATSSILFRTAKEAA